MGCGASKVSGENRVEVDGFTPKSAVQGPGAVGDHMEEELNKNCDKDTKADCIKDPAKAAGKMEENEKVEEEKPDESGGTEELDPSVVISQRITKNSKKHVVLQTATLGMFVAEGKNCIEEINQMPFKLESMPENFKSACKLRQVYHNARYHMSSDFCNNYLDQIKDEGLFTCLVKAFHSLQQTWPKLFLETSDPNEEFKPAIWKLTISNLAEPETGVASVWLKLNATILGITDMHEDCRIMAANEGLLEYFLMEAVPALSKGGFPGSKTVRGKLLSNAISSIYNCSMAAENASYFEQYDGINKLLQLSSTPSERLNMTVLFGLAYLIDEKNNHLIMSTNDTLDKIIHFLSNANNMVERRYCGLSNIEIANALTRVAVNDENKRMIGRRNGLLPLVKMFQRAKSDDERISAANALWMLLFDAENRELLKQIDAAFESLQAHEHSENKELSKAVSGITWEMKTKHDLEEKAGAVSDLKTDSGHCKHIMISYNWEQQPLMLNIRDSLKGCGYKVWIDVDKIGGSTLQAMASAVENSAVILIAVSRKYKESANCRSEAEYAFQLKKDVVPLMIEKNYQPDGWLGLVVGAKFWIDFTKKAAFINDISKLKREIGSRGKMLTETAKAIDEVDLAAAPLPSPSLTTNDQVRDWSNEKVKDWLHTKGDLEKLIKKSIVDKLNGRLLVSLNKLQQESPDVFFTSLRADFGFADILDLLQFSEALSSLIDAN